MKKVFITGASGFLAEKIVKSLKKNRDIQITLGARNISKLQASPVRSQADFIIEFDMGNSSTFKNITTQDVVIHLAQMDHGQCVKNPSGAQFINVTQVEKLLAQLETTSVSHFIFMSTIHVYGANLQGKVTEETPTSPTSIYAKTHLEAEFLVAKSTISQKTILRLSNAVGRPSFIDSTAWSLAAMDLCKQAIEKRRMILKSSGRQFRDFIPTDAIGNIVHDLIADSAGKSSKLETYNLSSGRSITINELCALIQKEFYSLYCENIPLMHEVQNEEQTPLPFTISNEKLLKDGFHAEFDLAKEIQSLLSPN